MHKMNIPVFSIAGTLDRIVPSATIEDIMNLPIPNKKIEYFDQGHLGIILHQETVNRICKLTDDWINGLDEAKKKNESRDKLAAYI